MLTITFTARIKCKRHPGFDPKRGIADVKGNCPACQELLALQDFGKEFKRLLVDRIDLRPGLEGKVK